MPRCATSLISCNDGDGLHLQGEHGSQGFEQAIADNMDWFSGATLLMNNNNTWMGEDRPCLTYGLRGCVELDLEVRSRAMLWGVSLLSSSLLWLVSPFSPRTLHAQVEGAARNLHSGVDGGSACEPLTDISAIVASLTKVPRCICTVVMCSAAVSLTPPRLCLHCATTTARDWGSGCPRFDGGCRACIC